LSITCTSINSNTHVDSLLPATSCRPDTKNLRSALLPLLLQQAFRGCHQLATCTAAMYSFPPLLGDCCHHFCLQHSHHHLHVSFLLLCYCC
jgi:hypothetical protein